jgi:hypothetical protein
MRYPDADLLRRRPREAIPMSAAAPAGLVVAVPEMKRQLWATAAIVLIDSLWLDLYILRRTFDMLLTPKGAY